MAEKMNMTQKFQAIVAMLEGEQVDGFTVEEAIEFLMDRAEKAKSKPRAAKGPNPETIEFRAAVATALSEFDEPVTAKQMAEKLKVSTQKASAALRALVQEDVAVVYAGEKARDAKTYALA